MTQNLSQTSAQRKLSRGIEQVETLRREIRAFKDRDAYVFRVERDPSTPQHVEYRCFAIERETPPDHWPLLAGEAVQNLRSALDHAVYAIAKRPTTRTQFPIFIDPCEFQVRGKPMVKGVPEPICAAIERAQPYNRLPERPEFDRLWQLRFLSNLDKHRTLAVVATAIDLELVGLRDGVHLNWNQFATERTLGHGETHISSFTATSEAEIEEVDVSPDFSFEVRVQGQPVSHLVAIAMRVFEVVTEIESGGEPISPFAAYPISL